MQMRAVGLNTATTAKGWTYYTAIHIVTQALGGVLVGQVSRLVSCFYLHTALSVTLVPILTLTIETKNLLALTSFLGRLQNMLVL